MKWFRRILPVVFALSLMIILPIRVNAATSYPQIKNNGKDTWISEHWLIRFNDSSEYDPEYDSTADIIYFDSGAHGDVRGSLNLGAYGGGLRCIGKYNGKFYFNVYTGYGAGYVGIYTIKPGDVKFTCVSRNINIREIEKANLMSGRYILGFKYMTTDPSSGLGSTYVYDLKTNKKVSLGEIQDARKIGKKLYYLKKSANKKGKLVLKVYKCKHNGKSRKLVKAFTLKLKAKGDYGYGRLTSKKVQYHYIKDYKSRTITKKYRK